MRVKIAILIGLTLSGCVAQPYGETHAGESQLAAACKAWRPKTNLGVFRSQPPLLEGARRRFSIPATTADVALNLYQQQSGRRIEVISGDLPSLRTKPIEGEFDVSAALPAMLDGVALKVLQDGVDRSILAVPSPCVDIPLPDTTLQQAVDRLAMRSGLDWGYLTTTQGKRFETALLSD